jgi:hypothetical protein
MTILDRFAEHKPEERKRDAKPSGYHQSHIVPMGIQIDAQPPKRERIGQSY